MSESYERPRPAREPGAEQVPRKLNDPRPDRGPAVEPADDSEPGISPALESEGGGPGRSPTRTGGIEGV
jgi:hypothetical protein